MLKIQEYMSQGFTPVYTDGASQPPRGLLPRVGGYGVFFGDGSGFSSPIPQSEPQTNNRGELRGALHALQTTPHDTKLLLISDSKYVVGGLLGGAHKWKRNGWRCSTGEAQHADLWNKILP